MRRSHVRVTTQRFKPGVLGVTSPGSRVGSGDVVLIEVVELVELVSGKVCMVVG